MAGTGADGTEPAAGGRARLVVAVGGNALLRRGEPLDLAAQRRNVEVAARHLAALAPRYDLVVTHGNGPQVGLLALQAAAYPEVAPYDLDVLGAETEGMIGYLLEVELANAGVARPVAAVLTCTVVERDDPAFAHPTKPVGPVTTRAGAEALRREHGWAVAPVDPGDPDRAGWRRVVPSPEPVRIREIVPIRLLVERGVVVVCAGGGGIPVVVEASGALRGVEAVVDKDLAAALLARELGAAGLLLLTDVDAVYAGWGTAAARPVRTATVPGVRAMGLAAGSMGPKAEAACRFVESTGGWAAIGALGDAPAIVAGRAGTRVTAAGTAAGSEG